MLYNIHRNLKILSVFSLIFLLLIVSLLYNSIDYLVDFRKNNINVKILEHVINIPITSSEDVVRVNFYPQTRYSSKQYLITDKGFFVNLFEISKNVFFKKNPSQDTYQQFSPSKQRYIHFNPFRSSFQIVYGNDTYRFEVNIPDSSLEFWKDNEKLSQQTIKPPWLRLIFSPLFSSLATAVLILYLSILFSTFFTNRRSSQNPDEEKASFIENSRFAQLFPIFILLAGMFLVGFIFKKVFHAMPGFGDEINYLIQAKIFASGKLYVAEPYMPEFFKVNWMDIFGKDGKLWNFQPPGNSILLAIGSLVGTYWITVPIVGGSILAIQFLIAKNLLGKNSFAFLHVIVVTTSHFFLSLTSSFMAHAPSLLFISLFYLMIIKTVKVNNQKLLIYAGIFLGVAFLIRPLSALLSAIVPLVLLLAYFVKQRCLKVKYVMLSIIACFSISSLIFFYTFFITGNFTLPYFTKGPEVGQTLLVRLEKPWKLSNLYRNYNEFQNRVHSFGYVMNFSLFFIPLLIILKSRFKWWILAGYSSFFTYLILHSFLHWYGWKWEPRMIYDISFIFFILTSYGVWILYEKVSRFSYFRYIGLIFFMLFIFYLTSIDLPNRFTTEYKNYNFSPSGVKELISKQKITNSIIFFNNKNLFAPYSPQNAVTFDGDIIYAINNGQDYNYKLITKFPKKDVYYSYDAQSLIKSNNFYKDDLYKIKEELEKYKDENFIIVLPWRDNVQSLLDDMLPGKKVSEAEFLNLFKRNSFSKTTNTIIVFVGNATGLSPIIDMFSQNITIDLTKNYDTTIQVKQLEIPIQRLDQELPGIKMTCYQGTNWNGIIIKDRIVAAVDANDCFGENTSIRWETTFDVPEAKTVIFYIQSDDGSAIILNDETVLDNNLYQTHGAIKKTTSALLKKGNNYLEILYLNGPAEGFINVGVIDPRGNEQPLSITSFESFLIAPNTIQK